MPSQAELFKRYYNQNKINARSENLQKVISKYGGEEYLAQPDELKLTNLPENEGFIEYTPSGKVKTIVNKVKQHCSIYPEDVHVNGHSEVWGSFYNDDFGWGYKCCMSFDKNSFCNGSEGRRENKEKIVRLIDFNILLG